MHNVIILDDNYYVYFIIYISLYLDVNDAQVDVRMSTTITMMILWVGKSIESP